MNCLIYLRVSTKEQAEKGLNEEGYSIPAQRKACLNYINDKDWVFVDEYVDRGESARSSDRPQLKEMLEHIKRDPTIDAMIVHKLDRLARNVADHVAIKTVLKKHNITLVSVSERIEETASGKLMENIFASFAEFYSENLGAETRKGMNEKARQGGWPQYAPVGYVNIKETLSGRVISKIDKDPDRAPLIKQAFEMYATGNYSIADLTDHLKELGFKSRGTRIKGPGLVAKSTVARILQNPFYVGMVKWNDIFVKGFHEPLIDERTYDLTQQVLKLHNSADERSRKHDHYLKGTLFCGECGSRLSIAMAKSSYMYFYCLGQKRRNGCKQPYTEAFKIERNIEILYEKIKLAPKWSSRLREKLEEELYHQQAVGVDEEVIIRKRLTKLAEERTKLLHAYFNSAIPVELLKQEQERITQDVRTAEFRLEQLSSGDEQLMTILDTALKMAENCCYAYKKAKPKARQNFNQAIFNKIAVKNGEIVKVHYTELFDVVFRPEKVFAKSSNSVPLAPRAGLEPAT